MVLKTVHLAANEFINRNTASVSTLCQWFSNCNVHMTFQKRLSTCRFSTSRSEVGPKIQWFAGAQVMLLLLTLGHILSSKTLYHGSHCVVHF